MKKKLKKNIILNNYYKILGFLFLIALWWILSIAIDEKTLILPSPIDTLVYLFDSLKRSYIYLCIVSSIWKMILGFIIAFVLAFILGIIAGNSNKIKSFLSPLMTLLRSVPTACLIYLFLLLLGVNFTSVSIVVLICFPIIYESICLGIESTPRELIEASLIDGSNIINTNLKIKIPLSIPYIKTGIKASFSLAFKIEVMSEVVIGSSGYGIGNAIISSSRSDPTNMVPIFAYSFICIFLMIIIDNIVKINSTSY